MSTDPCQICGCTDLNLVDGYYYCVECGTQDANVRETVIEKSLYADGTFVATDTKKLRSTVLKDAVQMSGEWCKWHAYNFILSGLTDELIAAGAKPSVKIKVLWIWLRYIKKFQKKDEPEAKLFENKSLDEEGEENEEELNQDNTYNELDEANDANKSQRRRLGDKFTADISFVTKTLLLSMLYVALNLDRSDIQLNNLFQFIREGRLSLHDCTKFIPKELTLKSIPNYIKFVHSFRCEDGCTPVWIRALSMTLFKSLDLGVPLAPDLNKIINNYVRELCLPDDFKDLVLSLTSSMPCDLQMDNHSMKCSVRIPDYEAVCMSYVLLGLKMCFGLDCDYEIKISDAVDKINCEENYLKCYKLGMYSEPTDRLFSFREWCMFIQFRKMILCKYYLPMATHYQMPVDDCVFMEHSEPRKVHKMKLSYDVAMDILNKIPSDDTNVIPKKEFPTTLTPMTTYTEVMIEYINDPDLKLRLCEDFTQYSLTYATRDLKLPGHNKINEGVGNENKIINPCIDGSLISKVGDTTIVLVRNCDNKNWLKTRPPQIKHVTKINSNSNNSSCEITSEFEMVDSTLVDEDSIHDSDEEACDVIEEEDQEISIFDDDFKNLLIEEDYKKDLTTKQEEIDAVEFNFSNLYNSNIDVHDSKADTFSEISTPAMAFNPETFDRQKVIQELIELACKKYKIRLPKEKVNRVPVKRKNFDRSEAGLNESKRKRPTNKARPGEVAKVTQGLIDAYYENINNDLLLKISEHVKSVVETVENEDQCHTDDALNNQRQEIDIQNQNDSEENLQNDDNDQNHDQDDPAISVVDDDNDDGEYNIEELLPKIDPKFDPKTHDIKQLYVKFKDEFEDFDIANIDNDPDIQNMIDQKISEFRDYDESSKQLQLQKDIKDNTEKGKTSSSDSDDGILEDKLSFLRNRDTSSLENLLRNRDIKKFDYWMRHYTSKVFRASRDLNHKFNAELAENCPKSFVFVINECAIISNCTAYTLYKKLVNLENRIFNHKKKVKENK